VRIAVAGKGGVGKTTFSATLARLEARRGTTVLTVDGDSNPNLAAALGIDPAHVATTSILPTSLVSRRLTGPALTTPVDDVLAAHAVPGPDGVRLVLMGMTTHAEEGCLCSSHATVSALLGDLATRPDTVTILDLEASPEHLGRGTTRHADALVLITEPYWRSLETVRRMALLASELPIPMVGVVVNKVRSAADAELAAEFCANHSLTRLGEVPWSDAVVEADVARVPLLDADPAGPVVTAIAGISDRLHEEVHLTRAPGGA
jgi:CO dehydrogenase maturation factor